MDKKDTQEYCKLKINFKNKTLAFETCIWQNTEAWLEGDIEADECEDCPGIDIKCEDYCTFGDYQIDALDYEIFKIEDEYKNNLPKIISAKDIQDYFKKKKSD